MLRVLLIICLLLPGCDKDKVPLIQPGSHYPPEKIFRHLIESPVPPCISSLQGDAETWQGYGAWLRFKASAEYIDSIISSGYTPVKWTGILSDIALKLPEGLEDRFEPPWDPESLTNKKGYKKNVKNDWTHSGTHYFIIDHENGIVYFYGWGA